MLDDHALRPPGGARRVDRVGNAALGSGRAAAGTRGHGGPYRRVVQPEHRGPPVEAGRGGDGGEHGRGLAVGDHEVQPARRVGRVERHVRRPGVPHRQHGDHEVGAALQAQPDHAVLGHPGTAQVPRQPGGPFGQAAVGERPALARHRHGVGSRRRPGGYQLRDAADGGRWHGGVIPLLEELAALGLREHRHVADVPGGGRRDGTEQHAEMACHPGDGRGVEQRGRVLDHARQPAVGRVPQRQPEVEPDLERPGQRARQR